MMKLILFGLLCLILAVQSDYKMELIGKGDPFTFRCDKHTATWKLRGSTVAYCEDCPSIPCTIHTNYTTRIKAFCNKTNPIFHIDSTTVHFDASFMSCSTQRLGNINLRVGKYDGRLHAEKSTVALEHKSFTLVYDKRKNGYIQWYKKDKWLAGFDKTCKALGSVYDKNKFEITCEEDISKLYIKNVTPRDDGELFACSENRVFSLFRLTVNGTDIPTGALYLVLLMSLLSISL